MSLTRRQLVRAGAAATWARRGRRPARRPEGSLRPAAAVRPQGVPGAGAVTRVTVLRASSYDADLGGLLLDGLRDIDVDVRAGAWCSSRTSSSSTGGRDQHRPAARRRRDRAPASRRGRRCRRRGARAPPGHGGGVAEAGLLEALDDAGPKFVDLNEAPVVRVPLRTYYTGLRDSLVADRSCATRPMCRVDAEAQDPPLGRCDAVAEELLRLLPGRVYGWPKNVLHCARDRRSILDIAATVRPELAIIDGIVGMEGDGPLTGRRIHSGVLVVSTDPVAADVTGARLMGFEPEKLELPDGSRPLPRAGPFRVDRATRRGSRAADYPFPPGPGLRAHRRLKYLRSCGGGPNRAPSAVVRGVTRPGW